MRMLMKNTYFIYINTIFTYSINIILENFYINLQNGRTQRHNTTFKYLFIVYHFAFNRSYFFTLLLSAALNLSL